MKPPYTGAYKIRYEVPREKTPASLAYDCSDPGSGTAVIISRYSHHAV